jgi:hypothetical protein
VHVDGRGGGNTRDADLLYRNRHTGVGRPTAGLEGVQRKEHLPAFA